MQRASGEEVKLLKERPGGLRGRRRPRACPTAGFSSLFVGRRPILTDLEGCPTTRKPSATSRSFSWRTGVGSVREMAGLRHPEIDFALLELQGPVRDHLNGAAFGQHGIRPTR